MFAACLVALVYLNNAVANARASRLQLKRPPKASGNANASPHSGSLVELTIGRESSDQLPTSDENTALLGASLQQNAVRSSG